MSDCILKPSIWVYFFVELSEKMETDFWLIEFGWWSRISWQVSLSGSSPVLCHPPGIPVPYKTWTPTGAITCLSFSFSSLGSHGNGNPTSPITAPPELCVSLRIASYGGSRRLLHACVQCWLMGARDIGEREKAVIPGRMTFCRTGLCLDHCEGSNAETKHQASSCSMKPRGEHG